MTTETTTRVVAQLHELPTREHAISAAVRFVPGIGTVALRHSGRGDGRWREVRSRHLADRAYTEKSRDLRRGAMALVRVGADTITLLRFTSAPLLRSRW